MSSDPMHRNYCGMIICREGLPDSGGGGSKSEGKESRFSWPTYIGALGTLAGAIAASAVVVGNYISKLGDEVAKLREDNAKYMYVDSVGDSLQDMRLSDMDSIQTSIRTDLYGENPVFASTKSVNGLERQVQGIEGDVARLDGRVDGLTFYADWNNLISSLKYEQLGKEIGLVSKRVDSVKQQGRDYFDALKLGFAEFNGQLDSVNNVICSSIAFEMNEWIGEHNDSSGVIRRGGTAFLGHNGNGLPKVDYKDVRNYIAKDSTLSQEVRNMASAAVLGIKDISNEEVQRLASLVAVGAYNSETASAIGADFFFERAESHNRFGIGPNGQSHDDFMSPSLRGALFKKMRGLRR
jgi:hypothetical protein